MTQNTHSTAAGLALLAGLWLAVPVSAQDFALEELVFSGGFTPISAAGFGRSVTVLDRAEIAARGVDSVTEALRSVPGVTVSNGGTNQVRIRGSEDNHTLILVNGVEVQLPSSGAYDMGNILLSDIARIEVLKGPQSALYGANAAGGVIAITTVDAAAPIGQSGSAFVELGTQNTKAAGVNLSQSGDRLSFAVTAFRRTSDGFDVSNDANGTPDKEQNTTLTFDGSYALTDTLRLTFGFRGVERREGYDDNTFPFNFPAARADYVIDNPNNFRFDTERQGYVALTAEGLGGRLEHSLRATANHGVQQFNAFTPNDFSRRQLQYRGTFGLDGTLDVATQTVTAMLETETETLQNANRFNRTTRSVALEYRGAFGNGFDVQAGARFDDNETFADTRTWNVGLSYQLTDQTRLRASAGTGVVNPTLIEQFGFFNNYIANPNLTPERSFGFDAGIEHSFWQGRASVEATVFSNTITDRISLQTVGANRQPINLAGQSTQRGLELAARAEVLDWLDTDLTYTFIDARDPDGTQTERKPRHTVQLDLSARAFDGRGRLGLNMRHVAGAVDRDPRTGAPVQKVALAPYTIFGLSGSYDLTDTAQLYGRVDNLFDTTYEENWGYVAPGRSLAFGLRTTF